MKVSKKRSYYRAVLYKKSYWLVLCVVFMCVCVVHASEFRTLKRIPTPKALLEGVKAVEEFKPVDRRLVVKAVNMLMDAWNTAGLEQWLADTYTDKTRILDAIDEKAPRDARLRILSIQGIQTMEQHIQTDASGVEWVVSNVSATVKTQLEFNDAVDGFQRLEGLNEYMFWVAQENK